jgi:hypothetical protein
MKKTLMVVIITCAGIMHAMERDVERIGQENLLNTGLVIPVMEHSSLGLVTSQGNNSPINTPSITLHSLAHTQSLVPMPVIGYVPLAVINIPVQQYHARIPRFVRINPIMQESRELLVVASALFTMGVIVGLKLAVWSDDCNQ